MRKSVLILIYCLLLSTPAFAQNNIEGMRLLTVNAMVQYGQKLYERGDFDGACAVFNRVLSYDQHQRQALEYLKEMGRYSMPSPTPVLPVKAAQPPAAPKNDPVMMNIEESPLKALNITDMEAVKRAIEDQKKIVDGLKNQIKQMRADIAAQSVTEK